MGERNTDAKMKQNFEHQLNDSQSGLVFLKSISKPLFEYHSTCDKISRYSGYLSNK